MSDELGVSKSQARPRGIATGSLLVVLLGGLTCLSVMTVRLALCVGGPLWVRSSYWVIAAFFMSIPVWLVFVMLRRKIKTGRFLLSPSEVKARRAEMQSRMGVGKPFWPQASLWVAPLLFSAFFLCLGLLAIAGAASLGPSASKQFVALLVLAAVLLFLPSQMIFKAVRRKVGTGSYLLSEEELAATRLRSGKLQPLWLRVLPPSVILLSAVLQTYAAIIRFRSGHGSFLDSLVVPCLWWAMGAFWIWPMFPPKPRNMNV